MGDALDDLRTRREILSKGKQLGPLFWLRDAVKCQDKPQSIFFGRAPYHGTYLVKSETAGILDYMRFAAQQEVAWEIPYLTCL